MKMAIIPAYNEERTIQEVITHAQRYVDEVVVVNDGSSDGTFSIASSSGCTVLTHIVNRGLGSALRTGFAYALAHGAAMIVTLDADGQHAPEDIPRLFEELQKGYDVVVGSRMREGAPMPWQRVIANIIGNILAGGRQVTTDSQSGLRALSAAALASLELHAQRMEISSEIIDEVRRKKLRYSEIAITPVYSAYSLSKGQSFVTGMKTLGRLVYNRLYRH